MSTKESVFSILLSRRGTFVSGEELAQELDVSRVAVWKAIQGLMEDGAVIESSKGQGYRLDDPGYNQLALSSLVSIPVFYLDEVDSTNSEARRLAASGQQAPFVVIARRQSSGRGRRGRSFESGEGGIYLSLVVDGQMATSTQSMTTRTALGVAKAIESLGLEVGIKWVNDIYVHGRKAVGILCEGIVSMEESRVSQVVIGVGVNWTTASFPPELEDVAVSLFPDGKVVMPKADFVALEVDSILASLKDEDYLDGYRKRCFIIGRDVDVVRLENRRRAHVEAIDDEAHLVVRYEDGQVEHLSSGEVSVRPLA